MCDYTLPCFLRLRCFFLHRQVGKYIQYCYIRTGSSSDRIWRTYNLLLLLYSFEKAFRGNVEHTSWSSAHLVPRNAVHSVQKIKRLEITICTLEAHVYILLVLNLSIGKISMVFFCRFSLPFPKLYVCHTQFWFYFRWVRLLPKKTTSKLENHFM